MKEIISLTLIIGLVLMAGFVYFEPEQAEAVEDVIIVTQNVTGEISISSPSDVTMSPDIPGMTGGTGDGSATWTVVTSDTSGFNLSLKASTDPAMQSGANSFADYTAAGGTTPDYDWSIAAADSEFGFTVEPATVADTDTKFKDNGSACNTGALNTADKCWLDFTTSNVQVINRTSGATSSSGEAEVVKFKAQSGTSHYQVEGSYTATITATAVTN